MDFPFNFPFFELNWPIFPNVQLDFIASAAKNEDLQSSFRIFINEDILQGSGGCHRHTKTKHGKKTTNVPLT